MSEWKPIETAPRQESIIVGSDTFKGWMRLAILNALGEISYEDRSWLQQDWDEAVSPTHWMYRPPPPNKQE